MSKGCIFIPKLIILNFLLLIHYLFVPLQTIISKTAIVINKNDMTLNRKKRLVLAAIAWLLVVTAMVAQPSYRIIDYAKLNDGVTTVHRIVRDNHGMMWFATDDGLYRYDGYQFVNFKSHSGDGVNMPSNRINSMYASSGGGIWIWCRDVRSCSIPVLRSLLTCCLISSRNRERTITYVG